MNARIASLLGLLLLLSIPQLCRACACGCSIFEVGTATMLPQGTGGLLYFEYDFQDQNHNWSGNGEAPNADNTDKEIRTDFMTAGLQYFFNRSWGIQTEIPYDNRTFKTVGGPTGDQLEIQQWSALGDIRVEGIYSGFFPDQSAGITFGSKFATGNWSHNDAFDDVDRDSELGTGSTDLLLGGYYRHNLFGNFDWFAQTNLDLPVFIQHQYRPGLEVDSAVGTYLNGLSFGNVKVTPIAQMLISERAHDSGAEATYPIASGYQRLLLSPGIEFDLHPFMIYADVELPVYQHFTGDQVAASVLYKVIFSYRF
jgi:hypothetical protein